jgi:hypothetical protein
MSKHSRWFAAVVAVLVLGVANQSSGQLEHLPYMLRFNDGQDVQPIFEGWSKTDDGGFRMHFGYLNRNYVEEPVVPVGPDNSFNEGQPDRGQPTYFYPRVTRRAFTVSVPKDWGKKELIWTVTVHGKSNKAVAWLQPEWEIDPGNAGRAPAASANKAPTISAESPLTVTLPATLTLAPTVADDGLPKPDAKLAPRRAAVGQETPPILQPSPLSVDAPPVNVPDVQLNPRGQKIRPPAPPGLSVSYLIWRAPAVVAFEPYYAPAKDGKASTVATFTAPGTYVLRARATDRVLTTEAEVVVNVRAAAGENGR